MIISYKQIVTLLIILHFILAYEDFLSHTAIDKIPAIVGNDVELRCTKIIEKFIDDHVESSSCDPSYETNCYHQWLFNGKKIGRNSYDDKYSSYNVITEDYCENFSWSTELIKEKFDFIEIMNNSEWYNHNMRCLASVLTIKNVQKSDFGLYSCNFSDHSRTKAYYGDYYNQYEIENITLYNAADISQTQATKVEYFETFYTKGIKSKILMQCVATGNKYGKIYWFVQYESKSCPRWSNPVNSNCSNNTIINIEDLNNADIWRCYNFSVASHTPHHPDITESFIFFENICGSDWGSVFCSPDSDGSVRPSQWGYITEKSSWDDWYYRTSYYRDTIIAIMSIVMTVMMAILFIVAGVMACVRGKVYNCCKPNDRAPMFGSTPLQMPVISYRVQPVPQHA